MRYIIWLTLLIAIKTNGQPDCEALDSFTSFHGIKFGERFPDSLRKYFAKDTTREGYIRFSMPTWYLETGNHYKKFSSWFNMGDSLSEMLFYCDRNQKVVEVVLRQRFEGRSDIVVTPNNYPKFFRNIIAELKDIFGSPSISDEKEIDDELTFYSFFWGCNKMCVSSYYAFETEKSYCVIMIYDYELKKKHGIDKYKL